MDCIGRTILLTEMTSDTSYGAGIHNIFTLILGAALYKVHCLIRNKFDQMLRTCSNTLATGLTYLLINLGDTIYDVDGIKRTSLHTGSEIGRESCRERV